MDESISNNKSSHYKKNTEVDVLLWIIMVHHYIYSLFPATLNTLGNIPSKE